MTGKEQVLAVLRGQALTDEEIAEKSGLCPSSARTRRMELELDGQVVAVGYGLTSHGRSTIVWMRTEDAHKASAKRRK